MMSMKQDGPAGGLGTGLLAGCASGGGNIPVVDFGPANGHQRRDNAVRARAKCRPTATSLRWELMKRPVAWWVMNSRSGWYGFHGDRSGSGKIRSQRRNPSGSSAPSAAARAVAAVCNRTSSFDGPVLSLG